MIPDGKKTCGGQRVRGREIGDENDNTDRKIDRNECNPEYQSTLEVPLKTFICDRVELIGESRNNELINDQSQPVQTEVADAGDDPQVLYAIDKIPPPKPSRKAKTMEVKEPKSHCPQQVRGSYYDHHLTYPHSHGV